MRAVIKKPFEKKVFLSVRLMKKIVFIAVWCFACFITRSPAADTANAVFVADSSHTLVHKTLAINRVNKNPITTAILSAILPGGGQLYTGNTIKSGAFFASEVILGLVAFDRYTLGKDLHKNTLSAFDLITRFNDSFSIKKDSIKNASKTADSVFSDTIFLRVNYRMQYDYAKFLEKENRYFLYQSLTWMAGLYYWNILDALKNTRYFSNDDPKKPSKAGWLSAIPALGLGQLYNGELSKAGMIFTGQLSMAYMVYNYNSLMRTCEDAIRAISTPGSMESKEPDAADVQAKWDSKRNDAFRNRNMWAWYSILFYLYGILDAVVDAHLHDAAVKMILEPDLLPDQKKIGMHITTSF